MLDDLKGEAEEIAKVSPWITCRPPPHTRTRQRARLSTPPAVSRYGPPLHAAREFGCRNKLFDLLDETRLLPSQASPLLSSPPLSSPPLTSSSLLLLSPPLSQAKDLAELILGCGPLPEPEADPEAFLAALTRAQAEVPAVFHPIKGSAQPWFNVQKFGKMLKGGGGECVLC